MIEVPVEPWNERYAVRIFVRPVIERARRTASSFDSAPVVVKKVRQPSPPFHGEMSESSCGELGALLVEEAGRRVAEGGRLLLDGLHDLGMTVAQVHRDEPAAEIEVLPAVRVEEVPPFAAHDHGGGEASLRQPGREDILRVLGLDLCGGGHAA